MWIKLRQFLFQYRSLLLITATSTALIGGLGHLGVFQSLELSLYDRFLRSQFQHTTDHRFLVITISETDLSQLGRWPLTDEDLAQTIQNISTYAPSAIGLDIYRDLPVPPGTEQIETVFQTTPNLIGVETVGEGIAVAPPPTLAQKNQVAIADLPRDVDNVVRRSLVSVQMDEQAQTQYSFGAALALIYLEQQGIKPEEVSIDEPYHVRLGNTVLKPLKSYDGGYTNIDARGYQILLGYRATNQVFETVSILDVMQDRVSPEQIRDRIVLIGVTAPSLNDLFTTPYSAPSYHQAQQSPGVFIHAHAARQLLDIALNDQSWITGCPEWLEWFLILIAANIGTAIVAFNLKPEQSSSSLILKRIPLLLGFGSFGLFGINFLLFQLGWWFSSITPLLSMFGSATISVVYHNHLLYQLAYVDALTQIANRRCFDQYLADKLAASRYLSLILCDVDYFKLYNDTYGHQAGDACLTKVAQALRQAIRRGDFVARYGGEEFVVVLTDIQPDVALQVAERMCHQVKSLCIPHKASKISPYVSLSCGVVSASNLHQCSIESLISYADKGLYQAKQEGRDRVVICKI
ncbi:MAG: CHASE2 domain-containing protein [Thainema sp.]